MATVTLIFHDYLKKMLRKEFRLESRIVHNFERRASIKDVIESLGIPHPIIAKLMVNGREVDFDYIMHHGDAIEAFPLTPPINPLIPTTLRPQALDRIAFVVDVNAGKLAMFLRMLGFDTVYDNDLRDARLAEIAAVEKRILLTRDTSLLKRKIVGHGYLLREEDPIRQLVEVIRLYDLSGKIKPLRRCMPCNGLLVPIDKGAIIERLEPLTKKYYHTFRICEQCGKLYWPGSHHEKIISFISKVLESANHENLQEN